MFASFPLIPSFWRAQSNIFASRAACSPSAWENPLMPAAELLSTSHPLNQNGKGLSPSKYPTQPHFQPEYTRTRALPRSFFLKRMNPVTFLTLIRRGNIRNNSRLLCPKYKRVACGTQLGVHNLPVS